MRSLQPAGRICAYLVLCLVFLSLAIGSQASAQTIRIMFLHHSTGEGLINEGDVREGLTALGYQFYDHGYNDEGLRLADGSYSGIDFDVPGDNTDPDGFAEIFGQPLHSPPDNTFSYLMEYDVIAYKSCFPTSNIGSDEQLADYQSYYLFIRDRMDEYPNKIFIVVTPPPQVPANTDSDEGRRARAFANWLQSDEYLSGHPNVFVFDFFDLLAGADNFLRSEYRIDQYDAHPNERANRDIGPVFVEFIDNTVQTYFGGERPPMPPEPQQTEGETPAQQPAGQPPAVDVIDDFEAPPENLSTDVEEGSIVGCSQDTETAHQGSGSLRMDYQIQPDGWVDCGTYFDTPQNWSGGSGIGLWLRATEDGHYTTLMLFSGPEDEPTPFEVSFETTTDWTHFTFQWSDFDRAEWADEGGLSEIDASQMTGYGISIGADEAETAGTAWVDDVGLIGAEITSDDELDQDDDSEEFEDEDESEDLDEEDAEDEDEDEDEDGICPLSAVGLPLAALMVHWSRRRSR